MVSRIRNFRSARWAAALLTAVLLAAADIQPQWYLEHVKFLAAPELEGRGAGTAGLEKAARYIADQFRAFGLIPPAGGDYLQPFPVTTNARLGNGNKLSYRLGDQERDLKAGEDFIPFNFSTNNTLSARVVFAGYGITAPEYNYDDYAGLDVKGKIVLVLRHEPQEFDENSPFAGKLLTVHAQFWSKAVNAKQHGAAGVIVIHDRKNHPGEAEQLEPFGRTSGPAEAGILAVQMRSEIADGWLSAAGKKLDEIQAEIDRQLKPRSFELPQNLLVRVSAQIEREVRTIHNVAGYLPGETPEYVVIGAHYDHLGLGEQFSLAPGEAGKPHPGADDNASGTAGVLELARWLSSQPKQKRGVLFLCFAGEEIGLLGSRYWVDHPLLPLENAVAMINLDMIGRVREGKVYVGGASSGSTFNEMLARLLPRHKLVADLSGSFDAGSSDHVSFMSKRIPALFFFSGLHADYHKPSDTWDKINAEGAAELLRAVGDVVLALLNDPARPQFTGQAGTAPAAGRGYGAWFGSVPDFTENPKGLRFADVREGSPAHKAGLRAGDILVEFDGKPIQNLYDFTYALRSKKPGEEVKVRVLRGDQIIEARVVLGERK
jgi:hypothetical protein